MIDDIRTARLLLRKFQPDDLDHFVRMHQDPKVMATLGGVRDAVEIKSWFDRKLTEWRQDGFSWWMIFTLDTGEFVGRGGLRRVTVEGLDAVEVGYGFLPEYWGRGFATELARESVRIGFTKLHFAELVAFTLPTNLASRRVMEKSGFKYERDIVHANQPHVLYRQTLKDYVERPGY